MNYNSALSVGDVLVRPKFFGLVPHVGVLVGSNAVLTNTPAKGEHLSTLQDFSTGETITVRPSGAEPAGVIARAQKVLASPKRYNAVRRNCQHTVTEIVQGVAESPLITLMWILGAVFFMWVLVRRR